MKRIVLVLLLSVSIFGCAVDLHVNNKKGLTYIRSLSLEPNTTLTIDFDIKDKVDISVKNKSPKSTVLLSVADYQKTFTGRQSISLTKNSEAVKITLANTGTKKSKVKVKIKSSKYGHIASKVE